MPAFTTKQTQTVKGVKNELVRIIFFNRFWRYTKNQKAVEPVAELPCFPKCIFPELLNGTKPL